jgi:3-hydroxyacyl-CoA dehydrogenase/3-hydroxy-2-methylbutyryl-CoA dehydrogenase
MNTASVRAIVTGGASGLGLATARLLVSRGAKVVIADLASSVGAKKAEELGKNCVFSPTDVTNEDQVKTVRDTRLSLF